MLSLLYIFDSPATRFALTKVVPISLKSSQLLDWAAATETLSLNPFDPFRDSCFVGLRKCC